MSRRKKIFLVLILLATALGGLRTFWFVSDWLRQPALVKNTNTTQLSFTAGQPIKWQKLIHPSDRLKGEHLVSLPKTAQAIKVIKLSREQSLALNTKLPSPPLHTLVAQARQNITAPQSLALAETRHPNILTLPRSLLANAEEAVGDIVETIVEPSTVTVDISTPTEATPAPEEQTPVAQPEPTSEPVATTTDPATTTDSLVSPEPAPSTTPEFVFAPVTTTTDLIETGSGGGAASPLPVSTTTETISSTTDILITYETPAPIIAETPTESGKLVTVSEDTASSTSQIEITNVLAFTTIPELYKVGQEKRIKIKWTNEANQEMPFKAYDTDNNGKLDYIEWVVPHLSTQTFEIVFIRFAVEYDENDVEVGDVTDQVEALDGNVFTLPEGHSILLTFEQPLTSGNEIRVWASSTELAWPAVRLTDNTFGWGFVSGTNFKVHRAQLELLAEATTTFSLSVEGSDLQVDYIGAEVSDIIEISNITDLQKIGRDANYPNDARYILTQDIDARETAQWNISDSFGAATLIVSQTGSADPAKNTILTLTVNATGGTYTFDYGGDSISSPIAYDASASSLTTALEETIGTGNVEISREVSGGAYIYTIEFINELANANPGYVLGQDIAAALINSDDLTGDLHYYFGFLPINGGYDNSSGQAQGLATENAFTGVLDGQGHKIINLHIKQPKENVFVGLFGVSSGLIRNLGLENVDISGFTGVGALMAVSAGIIDQVYVTGSVTGYYIVGGLAAAFTGGSLSNCYSTVTFLGGSRSAGLVGENSSEIFGGDISGADIRNCYVVGPVGLVLGEGDLGALTSLNNGTITGSYWDTQATGQALSTTTDETIYGKTTAQMKQQSTYVGWDFTNVWQIVEGVGYPTLRVFNPLPPPAPAVTPRRSSGSVGNQIYNLLLMGNQKLALTLARQFPGFFSLNKNTLVDKSKIDLSLLDEKLISEFSVPGVSLPFSTLQKILFKTSTLRLGSRSLAVKALQQFLNTHGFPVSAKGDGSKGRETSYFGPATRAALIKFQKANDLPPSGIFDKKTRTAVWWLSQ